MVVRMRHTRGHTANRRSHHALKNRALTVSAEGTVHPRHRVVLEGGTYRGRTLINRKAARIDRRAVKAKREGTLDKAEANPAPKKKAKKESKD